MSEVTCDGKIAVQVLMHKTKVLMTRLAVGLPGPTGSPENAKLPSEHPTTPKKSI